MGLAGCVNELLWPENEMLLFTLGKVVFDADDKLLFSDPMVELVELLAVPAMCGKPELPPRMPWCDMMFGADVLSPRDGVGMAGLMKRSLVRLP